MRISTGHQYDSYQRGIEAAHARLFESQMRMQTGKRLTRPSDDPFGSSAVVNMRSVQAGLEQYKTNLNLAKGWLGFTETALAETQDLLNKGYELAIRGASATNSGESRQAMAAEVSELQKRLVQLSNSQNGDGRYLFAGQRTDAPPFSVVDSALVFSGDKAAIQFETSPGSATVVNSQGDPLYTEIYARLESLRQNILNGSVGTLSTSVIPDLQASLQSVNLARGAVGARIQTVQELESEHTRRADDLTARISDVEDVDITEAITEYRLAEAAYEAALTAASQGFRLSLMDFIRG